MMEAVAGRSSMIIIHYERAQGWAQHEGDAQPDGPRHGRGLGTGRGAHHGRPLLGRTASASATWPEAQVGGPIGMVNDGRTSSRSASTSPTTRWPAGKRRSSRRRSSTRVAPCRGTSPSSSGLSYPRRAPRNRSAPRSRSSYAARSPPPSSCWRRRVARAGTM